MKRDIKGIVSRDEISVGYSHLYDGDEVSNSHYWPVTRLQQDAPNRRQVPSAATAVSVRYPIPITRTMTRISAAGQQHGYNNLQRLVSLKYRLLLLYCGPVTGVLAILLTCRSIVTLLLQNRILSSFPHHPSIRNTFVLPFVHTYLLSTKQKEPASTIPPESP